MNPSSSPRGRISLTAGVPCVTVPVLSSTTHLTSLSFSRAEPLLNNTPLSAPLPVPTMTATGVASPSAQGQEMTSTLTAQVKACSKGYPPASQPISTISAIAMTTGTNTPAILSAADAMGALLAPASSTSLIIFASILSPPVAVTRAVRCPVLFTVPPMSSEPSVFSTGTLSPLTALSSTNACPESTTESAGTDAPAFTTTMSPGRSSELSFSISSPPTSTIAVGGARSFSLSSASPVRRLDSVSRYFPTVTSAGIMPADSK